MKVVTSHYDRAYKLYIPDSANREPGLHISTVTKAMLRERYPRWFKDYHDDESIRQARIFEKGHIVEEAWGDALSRMVPFFSKPKARQVDGMWMSADGYAESTSDTTLDHWPYPMPLVLPAIFECKGGTKSTNPVKGMDPDQSYVEHEKFLGWIWNIMCYCHGWECQDAYLFTHHFNGNYKGHPPEPELWVHHLHWDQEELEEHWEDVCEYAKTHPELEEDS